MYPVISITGVFNLGFSPFVYITERRRFHTVLTKICPGNKELDVLVFFSLSLQDLHSVQQVSASGPGVSGVGRVLQGRRGVPVSHGAGPAASLSRRSHFHGLHPHGSVVDPAARTHPGRAALPAHRCNPHEQPQQEVGSGGCFLLYVTVLLLSCVCFPF